jgi:hypothetical protein
MRCDICLLDISRTDKFKAKYKGMFHYNCYFVFANNLYRPEEYEGVQYIRELFKKTKK